MGDEGGGDRIGGDAGDAGDDQAHDRAEEGRVTSSVATCAMIRPVRASIAGSTPKNARSESRTTGNITGNRIAPAAPTAPTRLSVEQLVAAQAVERLDDGLLSGEGIPRSATEADAAKKFAPEAPLSLGPSRGPARASEQRRDLAATMDTSSRSRRIRA